MGYVSILMIFPGTWPMGAGVGWVVMLLSLSLILILVGVEGVAWLRVARVRAMVRLKVVVTSRK